MRPLRGRAKIHTIVLPTFDPTGVMRLLISKSDFIIPTFDPAGVMLILIGWSNLCKAKNLVYAIGNLILPGLFLFRRMTKSPKNPQRQLQSCRRIQKQLACVKVFEIP